MQRRPVAPFAESLVAADVWPSFVVVAAGVEHVIVADAVASCDNCPSIDCRRFAVAASNCLYSFGGIATCASVAATNRTAAAGPASVGPASARRSCIAWLELLHYYCWLVGLDMAVAVFDPIEKEQKNARKG